MTDAHRQIRAIATVVAVEADLLPGEIFGLAMKRGRGDARHVAMLLAKQRTGASQLQIGLALGMHHTSIAHGVGKARRKLRSSGPFRLLFNLSRRVLDKSASLFEAEHAAMAKATEQAYRASAAAYEAFQRAEAAKRQREERERFQLRSRQEREARARHRREGFTQAPIPFAETGLQRRGDFQLCDDRFAAAMQAADYRRVA